MTNQSKGDYAVTLLDTDAEIPQETVDHIAALNDIIKVRVIK